MVRGKAAFQALVQGSTPKKRGQALLELIQDLHAQLHELLCRGGAAPTEKLKLTNRQDDVPSSSSGRARSAERWNAFRGDDVHVNVPPIQSYTTTTSVVQQRAAQPLLLSAGAVDEKKYPDPHTKKLVTLQEGVLLREQYDHHHAVANL